MAKKDKRSQQGGTEEVITLNLQPFLMPFSIILSAIIIATSILIGFDNLADNGIGVGTSNDTKAQEDTTGDTTTQPSGPQVELDDIKALFKDENLAFGDKDEKVLFVEVSDPSCPYCHIAGGENPELAAQVGDRFKYDTDGGSYIPPVREMKKLVDEGKASFVWIYTNGHGNGEIATQALYCAQEKGKFWQVHDKLMSNDGYTIINNTIQNDKSKAGEMATFLKDQVDSSFLKGCIESGKYEDRITEDQATASALGISGTPGFFVNTTNFAGAYSFSDMKSAVDEALN